MNRYEILLNKDEPRWIIEQRLINPNFKQYYMGEFVSTCSVSDGNGEHCPNKPEYFLEHNGREISLCEICYKNYQRGYFDQCWQRKNYGRTFYRI